ncbi:MAG: PsbP-related protein [Patescibacteria group bacterium]|nr:hypothetical protein [Patescibacteria group bacterium]
MNEKKHLLLALLITSLLVFLGLFVNQQTIKSNSAKQSTIVNSQPDPTANWKTYSKIVGFSFQYPNDWMESHYLQSSDKSMSIWIEGDSVGLECLGQTATKTELVSGVSTNLKYYSGLKNENCNNQGDKLIFFPFSVTNKNYSFTFTYFDLNKNEAEKLFNQILSTFKFTN